MKSGWAWWTTGWVLLLLCGGCNTPQPKPITPPLVRPTAFWPLTPGMSWTYTGICIGGTNGVSTTNAIRLTCAVLESKAQRGYLAVRLSNFPPALSPWEAAPTNTPYVLLRAPTGAWHAIEAGQARAVLARLADARDPLDDLLTFETQVLAEPLRDGLRWGDPQAMQRLDGVGCWVVGASCSEVVTNMVGVSKDWKLETFPVVYRTLPDQLELQFAPSIGILATDYIHHGTPGEVHLKLVEFHQP